MATPEANGKTQENGSTAATAAEPNTSVDAHFSDWLNAKLFEEVLKQNVPNFKSIKDFKVKPGLGAGENYATIMLRVEIELELQDGTAKSLSYMLKVAHENEWLKEMSKSYNIFTTEAEMYAKIVPELEEIYRNAGINVKFGCQYYKLNIDRDVILLEDLRPRGFKNANRLEGLDMEHTKCTLKKLAQWHAASAVRVETRGKYSDLYVKAFYSEESLKNMKIVTAALAEPFQRCLSSYEGHELYEKTVIAAQERITDEMFKHSKPDPNEFNVLNHGDCWCNNIMFQYDAFGKIKETYLIDYQVPKYGSPAQDLLYFIISSTKLELKLKQFEYLINYYHDQLTEHLQLLKYGKKMPSLRDIHIMLYKYGYWGLSTAASVMGAALLDPSEMATFDNFINVNSDAGEKFKLLMFSGDRYRKHIEAILPWLYNRGALEY